ncbi:MAG: ATP-binding protein [Burkholderiaceae bacterium]|nr:ATP-binding protein [Burkholderiaceae bacterium]
MTIIHGPNGVGKTVLLRLVASVLSGNLAELVKVPFETFEVTLSDGAVLGFRRALVDATSQPGDDDFIGKCYLRRFGSEELEFELKANQLDIRRWASRIERELPWLARIDKDRFIDRRSEEVLTSVELLARYSDYLPGKPKKRGFFSEAEWMVDIRNRVSVHLIEAQRLLRFSPGREPERGYWGTPDLYVPTVNTYAKDLQTRISETLTSYAKESQALDQSFPQRLLASAVRTLSAEELKQRMQALEQKRRQLKRIGLIDEDPAYPFDVTTLERLDETRRTVMTLYVEDTGRKLGVLDELARRIEILLENINKKFRHKAILIDREKGFVAKTDEQQVLDLEALSSGEQHEIVLLYDLLFRVKPNTLVLIDEPELSLHVTWQKSFLPDLLEIVATTGYDVVLATHSPFIVGDRHDLLVALSSDDEERKES